MNTAQMNYFLVAAETLNFTAAAERLYITQPSLSRQIAAIESELGVKLFIRSNNTVTLTDAGKVLYQRLSALYNEYMTIIKEVRDISAGTKGHLNIGILEDQYMGKIFVDEVRELLDKNPGCEINFTRFDSRTMFSNLMDGSIDAGLMLVYDEFMDYGFEYVEIDSAPAHIAINKDLNLANCERLSVDEMNDLLEQIPLAMVTHEQFPEPLQQSLRRFIPFSGLRNPGRVKFLPETNSVALYVGAGLAVTLTNRNNLLKNDPNIRLVPIDNIDAITQGLVWRKETNNRLLKELVTQMNRSYGLKVVRNQ